MRALIVEYMTALREYRAMNGGKKGKFSPKEYRAAVDRLNAAEAALHAIAFPPKQPSPVVEPSAQLATSGFLQEIK